MTLDEFRPDDIYYDNRLGKPKHDARTVPVILNNISSGKHASHFIS